MTIKEQGSKAPWGARVYCLPKRNGQEGCRTKPKLIHNEFHDYGKLLTEQQMKGVRDKANAHDHEYPDHLITISWFGDR